MEHQKVSDAWKHKYSYQNGSSSRCQYLRASNSKSTYLMPYGALSAENKVYRDNYTNAIIECNTLYHEAEVYFTSFQILTLSGLVILYFVSLPVAAVISLLVATVGGGGSYVTGCIKLVNSYKYYNIASDKFIWLKPLNILTGQVYV